MKKQPQGTNQKGIAILPIVIAVATLVPIILLTFSSEITAMFRSNHAQRVYNLMSVLETKIRAIAVEPIAYSGCGASTSTCTINNAVWNPYFPAASANTMIIAGAQCGGPNCGVVFAPTFNFTLAQLTVTITYNGKELGPQSTPVRTFIVQIPYEILHGNSVTNCPLTAPFFEGLDSGGNPVCMGLPSACPAGQFVTYVNPNTMAFHCSPLPSATSACLASQFISNVQWTGSPAAPTVVCTARKDPFLLGWPLW